MVRRPQVLLLDEPLAMLSAGRIEQAGALLRRLADELDIQIIMVSHQREFLEVADVAWELEATAQGVAASRVEVGA